jgi:hypothetical protein
MLGRNGCINRFALLYCTLEQRNPGLSLMVFDIQKKAGYDARKDWRRLAVQRLARLTRPTAFGGMRLNVF